MIFSHLQSSRIQPFRWLSNASPSWCASATDPSPPNTCGAGGGRRRGKWEFTTQKWGFHGINPWKWGCHGSLSMTNGEWSDWSIEIYETRLWLNHQTCRTWWFLLPEINQHRGIKSQQNFEFLPSQPWMDTFKIWLFTLWLCQNNYWKSIFIVNFPMNSMVIFHSYVSLYDCLIESSWLVVWNMFYFPQ